MSSLVLKDLQLAKPFVSGYEFDWILADSAGQVGLLCTAGAGPVPEQLRSLTDSEQDAYSAKVAGLPAVLPVLGVPAEEPPGLGADVETPEFGARGLFIYDWAQTSGPYTRAITPSVPVSLDAVLPHLGAYAGYVYRLRGSFSDLNVLDL